MLIQFVRGICKSPVNWQFAINIKSLDGYFQRLQDEKPPATVNKRQILILSVGHCAAIPQFIWSSFLVRYCKNAYEKQINILLGHKTNYKTEYIQIWKLLCSFFCCFAIRELISTKIVFKTVMCTPWASCIMKCPRPCCLTVWHQPCLMATSWCLQNAHWIVVCQSLKSKPEKPLSCFPNC